MDVVKPFQRPDPQQVPAQPDAEERHRLLDEPGDVERVDILRWAHRSHQSEVGIQELPDVGGLRIVTGNEQRAHPPRVGILGRDLPRDVAG